MTVKPPSPPFVGPAAHDSGSGNKPIHRVVIHSTVSPCREGQARDTAAYFRNPAAGGSAHYVVDPGEVVQVVWDSRVAWHAPPNSHSIGVELCDYPGRSEGDKAPLRRWGGKNHAAMLKRAAVLVAQLCLAYDVPIRKVGARGLKAGRHGICGHIDVSRAFHESSHWDPGKFPWRKFIRMVRRAARDLKAGSDPAPVVKRAERPEKPEPEHLSLRERAKGGNPKGRVDRARAILRIASNHAGNKHRRSRIREALRKWLPKR